MHRRIRRDHLEDFCLAHQPESKERITSSAFPFTAWLACKHNPLPDDELPNHPYKLLNISNAGRIEDGMHQPLSGETLKPPSSAAHRRNAISQSFN